MRTFGCSSNFLFNRGKFMLYIIAALYVHDMIDLLTLNNIMSTVGRIHTAVVILFSIILASARYIRHSTYLIWDPRVQIQSNQTQDLGTPRVLGIMYILYYGRNPSRIEGNQNLPGIRFFRVPDSRPGVRRSAPTGRAFVNRPHPAPSRCPGQEDHMPGCR